MRRIAETRSDRFHHLSREVIASLFRRYVNMEPGKDRVAGNLLRILWRCIWSVVGGAVSWLVAPEELQLLRDEREEENNESVLHLQVGGGEHSVIGGPSLCLHLSTSSPQHLSSSPSPSLPHILTPSPSLQTFASPLSVDSSGCGQD